MSQLATDLSALHERVRGLRAEIRKETTSQINKSSLRSAAEAICTEWFGEVAPKLISSGVVASETLDVYAGQFKTLLKLSGPSNLRSRYAEVLGAICLRFRDDLILPVQQQPKADKEVSLLEQMLYDVSDADENEYLREAVACAKHRLYRGCIVLGWCTAIDRIHRIIEKVGFSIFNATSKRISAETSGRFKRFNSPQSVNSLNELRQVFDSNVLWIIEAMGLIDNNQHTRLGSCFDMRNQSAHPGDAPVTEYNLLSFYSDINEILLRNPKFSL